MGSDARIVQAARLSTKHAKRTTEDRTLLRYLMRNRHWTPFEMCEVTFHMKMPIFVARQLVRHRTANINELSGRYSELPEEYYVPALDAVGFQAPKNKQGRGAIASEGLAEKFARRIAQTAASLFSEYRGFLGKPGDYTGGLHFHKDELLENGGIARELARINLPLSTYTEWFWKCDLRNIFNLLSLRRDSHAQLEIREYAEAMNTIVQKLYPDAHEAFEDYMMQSMTFSRMELKVLARFLDKTTDNVGHAIESDDGLSSREVEELRAKISRIWGDK
jgi:thymidylate synthase (FAD)